MNTPDIYEVHRDGMIETTSASITKKQGGANWLISTIDGLISLSTRYVNDYAPVTVFVRERGNVRAHVLWMHPNGGYVGSEF